ncbi:MAG: phage tail tape measure protein [Pirellulales bacterium]
MAIGAGIRAGKAFVEFVLGDKKLDGQMARIGKKLTKLGSMGVAATAPILAGFAAAALTFASVGSELADMSQRTNQSVESLSELSFAATLADTNLATVQKAMVDLKKKGINPARFDEIAADIAAIKDPADQLGAAIQIFGKKTGPALLPLLRQLPELRQKARDLGVTLSTEDAQAADELGDALDASKAQLLALAVQIGASIAGPLTQFLTWSQGMVASVIEFVKENPNMVAALAATTAAIAAVSAAAVVFGTILTIISLHPFIAAAALIAGLIVGIATYFGLASSGANEFKKSLDKVKIPGVAGGASPFTGQASQAQAQLQGALAGRSVSASPTISSAAASSTPAVRDVSAEIAHWTQVTAEGVGQLVNLVRTGGLATARR